MKQSDACAVGKERCCPSDLSWLKFDGYTDIVQNCLSVNSCIEQTKSLCSSGQGIFQDQNTIDIDSAKPKYQPWQPSWYDGCKRSCLEHHVHRRACVIWCSYYHKRATDEKMKEEHTLVLAPRVTVVGQVYQVYRRRQNRREYVH